MHTKYPVYDGKWKAQKIERLEEINKDLLEQLKAAKDLLMSLPIRIQDYDIVSAHLRQYKFTIAKAEGNKL